MRIFSRLFRLIRINFILVRYNLDEIIFLIPLFYPLRFLGYLNPWYWLLRKKMTRAERLRRALEALGPIFVKAGQIISTRRDLLPEDIANELVRLQDRVPPFPGKQAKKMIETALGDSLETVFSEFTTHALASASIAQVHAATLLDGQSVVVKVLRPHIRKIIDRDLDLLMTLAAFAERYLQKTRHLKPKEMVAEIAQTLYDELDLLREGANASQLRRNFADSLLLYVPKIYWQHSRPGMLVMERIHGIPAHDIVGLKRAGIDMKKLAERGIEICFTQIFRDSFFHADLHPGNLFVSAENPEDPTYIAVDFGIMGSLNQNDQRYIAENMVAFFKRDYRRVAELHIACGWLSPDTRVDQFEGAIRAVSEPIFERPLQEISFGQLLVQLFQVARRFNINIQPQLVLLQKTLLSMEGLSRQIAPDLDIWTSAAPYLEGWLKKQIGVRAFLRRMRENLPLWAEQLPELPLLVYEVLQETKQQKEKMRFAEAMNGSTKQEQYDKFKARHLLRGMGITLLAVGVSATFIPAIETAVTIAVGGSGLLALIVASVI